MGPIYQSFIYTPGLYTLPEIRIGKLSMRDVEISVISDKPFPRDRIIVGIMGSAGKERDIYNREFQPTEEQKDLGERIGRIIAERGCIASNGAAWGMPYFPIRGASRAGGYTMGISPFIGRETHEARNPLKYLDLVIYMGAGDYEDPSFDFLLRDTINTRYPDVVISIGGRWGTLDEDAHVVEKAGILVPIKGSGGATDKILEIMENGGFGKDMGMKLIIPDDSPDGLETAINKAIDEAERRWKLAGKTQNLFSAVIGELEKAMAAAY